MIVSFGMSMLILRNMLLNLWSVVLVMNICKDIANCLRLMLVLVVMRFAAGFNLSCHLVMVMWNNLMAYHAGENQQKGNVYKPCGYAFHGAKISKFQLIVRSFLCFVRGKEKDRRPPPDCAVGQGRGKRDGGRNPLGTSASCDFSKLNKTTTVRCKETV